LACKPDSVPEGVLRVAAIHLGLPSPTGSSGLPASRTGRPVARAGALVGALLALLRVGFTEPPRSPGTLVVSYTTVSPLPEHRAQAVCFLWHCPAGHPGLPLATTLPCGVRTFLDREERSRPRPPCQLVRYLRVRAGRPDGSFRSVSRTDRASGHPPRGAPAAAPNRPSRATPDGRCR